MTDVASARTVSQFIGDARARVDAALDRFLPGPPGCPPLLSAAMRYSLLGGGKRLRPILVLAAADAIARHGSTKAQPGPDEGDQWSLVLPAACAVEYIHTYSLIHDDLPAMDNDTLRRGRATLHVIYGDGIAILAGDALQAEAFALVAREPPSTDPEIAARKLMTSRVIAEAAGATGMVGGQAIDLQAAGQVARHLLALDADGLRAMHLRKTGALIRASAVSGAIMAGGKRAEIDTITEWASEIGLAFQIVDDILDVEGNAADLGKTAGKDAAGEKPTYPALFGLDRARAMAAECAERATSVLANAKLSENWLNAIADWVLTRRN